MLISFGVDGRTNASISFYQFDYSIRLAGEIICLMKNAPNHLARGVSGIRQCQQ